MVSTRSFVAALSVAMLCGLLPGYGNGYPSIFIAFSQLSQDCSSWTSETSCLAVRSASCAWNHTNRGECSFGDNVSCSEFPEAACKSHNRCFYDTDTCRHQYGWSALEVGVFGSAMVVGGLVGSYGTGPLIDWQGYRKVLFALGAVSLVGCAIIHASIQIDSFVLLIVGNVVAGAGGAAAQVLCPVYVAEISPVGNVRKCLA